MAAIRLIYGSMTSNIEEMAQAIAQGIREEGN
ncbi:flavodoxin [Paenibacillus baekrokdamisoli]|nr:flavodoxin [Paenibacillus baekrokdamisoli]